jgi:hypothetical protein
LLLDWTREFVQIWFCRIEKRGNFPMRKSLIVSLVTVAIATVAWCEDVEFFKQQSLKGLVGVHVVVENIPADLDGVGITVDNVKTKAELELRKAGIKVMTMKEGFETKAAAYLYVNLNMLEFDQGSRVCFSISVSLRQNVILSGGQTVYGSTWDLGTVGVCGRSRASSMICNESLQPLLESFANDFLAANPPKLSALDKVIKPAPRSEKPELLTPRNLPDIYEEKLRGPTDDGLKSPDLLVQ